MKYQPLAAYLIHYDGVEWRASFADLERLLGFDLPDSAREDAGWWANEPATAADSHAKAWLEAGFSSADVDMQGHRLTFRRDGQAPRSRDSDAAAPDRSRGPLDSGTAQVLAAIAASLVAGFMVGRALRQR